VNVEVEMEATYRIEDKSNAYKIVDQRPEEMSYDTERE